ncbi:MAG: hypothetical protein EOM91_07560 [Sphingobacteriia bacterium]|nr:hypothetical protein [Sphingobacteriia bacterium]NCC40543.1 hypothetical protein [Gammaproteobacteria bacterium]
MKKNLLSIAALSLAACSASLFAEISLTPQQLDGVSAGSASADASAMADSSGPGMAFAHSHASFVHPIDADHGKFPPLSPSPTLEAYTEASVIGTPGGDAFSASAQSWSSAEGAGASATASASASAMVP